MRKQFTWNGFKVAVSNAGMANQPWADSSRTYPVVYRYRVTITDSQTKYSCYAYGSQHNAQLRKNDDHESLGAMVLDELCSAYCDPDEFMETANSGQKITVARVKQIQNVIDHATKFGEPLIEACNKLRERKLA